MLETDNISVSRSSLQDNCFHLIGAGDISGLRAYKDGLIYVQDTAARLAVEVAAPRPGDYVIDGCSAPGGKAFASAISMMNTGRVTAFDIAVAKLRHITDGAKRMGLSIIDAKHMDAAVPAPEFLSAADIVIADVPCSGFGVIRKKPDIRYKKEADIAALPDIQRDIISGLSTCVKPGGVLLYSTCTVMQRENEDVVKWFLEKNRLFSLESFSLPGIGTISDGMLTLWPHLHGTDGFFICKLRKHN